MNNLNNEFTLNFLLNNSPEIKCTRRTRPGHLVKWNNAPSSSSKELTLGTSGSALLPATPPFKLSVLSYFQGCQLKKYFLRHRAMDFSSLTWRTGDSIPKHWPVMASSTAHWGQSALCTYKCGKAKLHLNSSQKFIYIYIYFCIYKLYIFTRPHQMLNCRNKNHPERRSFQAPVLSSCAN